MALLIELTHIYDQPLNLKLNLIQDNAQKFSVDHTVAHKIDFTDYGLHRDQPPALELKRKLRE